MRGFFPEILLAVCLGLQLIALIPVNDLVRSRLQMFLFLAGLGSVFVFSFLFLNEPKTELFSGAIVLDELFRLPRTIIILAALILGCFVYGSKTVSESRKPEILFMITLLCLVARTLLLSQNYLISFLCLLGMATTALFLTGLSFQGKLEGEAVLKWWFQLGLLLVFGFAALLIFALVAGGLQYSEISEYFKGLSRLNGLLFTILILLPFLSTAGLFPMHFLVIDRDHGAPWAVQAICSIIVTGIAVLATLKVAVSIFHDTDAGRLPLQVLEFIAIITAYWAGFGAYTQKNAKRFLAFFSISQWAALLLMVDRPTSLSLSSTVFYFLGLSLSLCLIYTTIATLHEQAESDQLSSAAGLGRVHRHAGVILLVGLTFFLFVPPFMGFPALLYGLASIFEQQSIWRVLNFTLIHLLYLFIAAHLAANIFFRSSEVDAISPRKKSIMPQHSAMSLVVGILIVFTILCGGIFWDPIMLTISNAAKTFII